MFYWKNRKFYIDKIFSPSENLDKTKVIFDSNYRAPKYTKQ